MNVKNYLEKHQPIVFHTLSNAFTSGNISHAYLLCGEVGTPLLEVATYLGKSLLCDNPDPFADDTCLTCIRIDDGNYLDFIVFDGNKESIKRGDVSSIEQQFEMTAYEEKGVMVYILNLVENMTTEAINAILKFLEEPKENVYAFLTTQNENNVLPTIVSRCQLLHLVPIDREVIINEAIEAGVNREDAEILSYIYNDASCIADIVNDKDEYKEFSEIRDRVLNLLNSLGDTALAVYTMEKEIIPITKTKEDASYVLDIITLFFNEALSIKNGLSPLMTCYDTILRNLIEWVPHLDTSLVELLKAKVSLKSNVNISLLLDHLINQIVSE